MILVNARSKVFVSLLAGLGLVVAHVPLAQAQFFFPFAKPFQPEAAPPPPPALGQRSSRPVKPKPKPVFVERGKKGKSTSEKAQTVPAELAVPKLTDGTAPYEPALLRLSEIMGALTYLRPLCGQNDGDVWRAKMSNLVEAEGLTEARRNRLAGAYNRGFRGYETSYRTCTDNARVVITRFVAEGSRIARDISNRFGGG